MTQWLRLTALDTLFFRGPERFDAEAGGGAYLSSVFPPHPGTVFAALNSALLNGAGLAHDPTFDHEDGLRARPGHHISRGPWLRNQDHDILLPAPVALLGDASGAVHLLRPSLEKYETDLGKEVHLPEVPAAAEGVKALEDTWLTVSAYQSWLDGQAPARAGHVDANTLWSTERHTGLERDLVNRTALEGHLYSAAHIRPSPHTDLLVNLPKTPAAALWGAAPHLPLGGEGRAVWVERTSAPAALPNPAQLTPDADGKLRYTLSLVTAGLGAAWGTAPGKSVHEGVPGQIVCCALGRPLRIGGFDTQMRMPERVRSARAAGSVWWLEADAADQAAVMNLHNSCIGAASGQGYGHVMIGAWAR